MLAVDTNVIVRLLTADDPRQAATAARMFDAEEIRISKTVLLETEWVLRRGYKLGQTAIHRAFVDILGLDHVHVEDEPAVRRALILLASGLDFADALHLSSRSPEAGFATFDRKLVQRATRAGVEALMDLNSARELLTGRGR